MKDPMDTRGSVVRRWDECSDGPLTEEGVRRLFAPAWKYRLSTYRHPAGTVFQGSMRASTCFVLKGQCLYRRGSEVTALCAGDVAQLPEGEYELTVGADDELRIIMVWELPPDFAGFG
jgi:hypothetical protein